MWIGDWSSDVCSSDLNFRKLSSGSFLSAFKFAPECLNFWLKGSHFGNVSGSLGTFRGKYCTNCRCFQSFFKFWVKMESAQNFLVLRESSARTTMCKKVCCTSILDLFDLSITYNQPRVTSGYERFAWVFGTFDKITLRFAMNMLFWFCPGMGHFAHFY